MKTTVIASLTAGASLLAGSPASAQTILYNCFFPPQHYVCTDFLPEMDRRIREATEDRVRLRVPPRSLAAPPDLFDGMISGVMDGTMQYNGFLAHQVAGMQLTHLPFVAQEGSEAASVALWETYQDFFAPLNEFGDVQLLSVWVFNGGEIFSLSETPIASGADIGGLKMWAPPGAPAALAVSTGSSVVAGPAVQMLELVSRGVVDGYVGLPYTEVVQYNLVDYTRSVSVLPTKIFQPSFSFMISQSAWQGIDETDRAAIMETLGTDFARYMGRRQDAINADARATMEAAGIEFLESPGTLAQDLEDLSAQILDDWRLQVIEAGVDADAAIAGFLDRYAAESATAE